MADHFDSDATPEPAPGPVDELLVERARQGDRTALDQLVRRHQPEVARLLWRFARRHADLDDLVQDVFLRVVRALPRWQPHQPFVHWLRRVTVNVGRDHCRREAVRRRWLSEPDAQPSGDSRPAAEALEPSADPAARAAAEEAKELLSRLPPDDRTLLTLHHLEGWDFATIGRHLGWSAPVTKLRAFRARRRLRSLLNNTSFPPHETQS
jgi:RNA polymerase sigma-70 factor, ECF subfamily